MDALTGTLTAAAYQAAQGGLEQLYQDDKAEKGVYIAARDYAAAASVLRSAMGWEPVKRLSVLQVAHFYRNVLVERPWPTSPVPKRKKKP